MPEALPKLGKSLGLTLSLGWLASVNILVTLVIHWYVITGLGIGVESDALYAGMVVPQLVLVLTTSSLLHVLVPLLAAEGARDLRAELSGILLQVAGAAALAAAALHLTAGFWMRWLVPGFSPEGHALAVELTRIQLFGLVFAGADCVLRAACRAHASFVRAEAATPLANVVGLALLAWALPRYGVRAAAWITVLRLALPVALMWPALGGWRRPRRWSPLAGEALGRIRPLLLGGLYGQLPPLVTRQLASLAPVGGLSLLAVSQQLYGAANTVLDKALVIPASPGLAVRANAGRWAEFRRIYRRRVALMGGLAGAGLLVVLLFGRQLLALVVGHGGVTGENVVALWWMLSALGVAYVSNAAGQPIFAAFCARGDTRTPVRLALVINTVNIPARAFAFWAYGLTGMALTMSALAALNVVVNIFYLERSIPRADGRGREGARGGEDPRAATLAADVT